MTSDCSGGSVEECSDCEQGLVHFTNDYFELKDALEDGMMYVEAGIDEDDAQPQPEPYENGWIIRSTRSDDWARAKFWPKDFG